MFRSHPLRLVSLAAALVGVALPTAARADFRNGIATTYLLSKAADGGLPNGPCRHPDISRDERLATVAVFSCEASNMVAGDTNGVSDVFAVHRAGPFADNGTTWEIGSTELVSAARGGVPANGRSWDAHVSGYPGGAPRCVAFLSDASNLVAGDTNGTTDAFVRDLRSHRTIRVSEATGGRQARGTTFAVSIDPDCTRVAFSSDAPNLALTRAKVPSARALLTRRPRPGTRQVYGHIIRALPGANQQLNGFTYLVSANGRGTPGNGNSDQPSMAKQRGPAVAFSSTASNLVSGDGNGQSDVFVRWMLNLGSHKFSTRLVSATRSGHSGSGASSAPALSGDGQKVSFQTTAPELAPGTGSGRSQIVQAASRRGSFSSVCASCDAGGPGDGSSFDPAMTYSGHFVTFNSTATNFDPARYEDDDPNGGLTDAFVGFVLGGRVYKVSQSSQGLSLVRPSGTTAASARGNYILFQGADQLTDMPYMLKRYPGLFDTVAQLVGGIDQILGALLPKANVPAPTMPDLPAVDLIYMRYLGPQ